MKKKSASITNWFWLLTVNQFLFQQGTWETLPKANQHPLYCDTQMLKSTRDFPKHSAAYKHGRHRLQSPAQYSIGTFTISRVPVTHTCSQLHSHPICTQTLDTQTIYVHPVVKQHSVCHYLTYQALYLYPTILVYDLAQFPGSPDLLPGPHLSSMSHVLVLFSSVFFNKKTIASISDPVAWYIPNVSNVSYHHL